MISSKIQQKSTLTINTEVIRIKLEKHKYYWQTFVCHT